MDAPDASRLTITSILGTSLQALRAQDLDEGHLRALLGQANSSRVRRRISKLLEKMVDTDTPGI